MGTRRVATIASLTLAVHLSLLSPVALAQQQYGAAQAGPDAVVLKDGGVIRGTLSEMVPGDHATVLLSTGQAATIRWDVISRIERNGAPVQAAPTPAPTTQTQTPPPPPPPAPTGPQGNAVVHIDADPDVRLERQSSGTWAAVCNAPCDHEVPLDGNYRIAGGGIRTSNTFRLLATRPGDHVIISVNAASKGGFVGGIILASIGAPFAVLGGLVLLVVAAIDSAPGHVETGGAKAVGWSMFGLGVVGVITGIVLISNNASTSVDQFNDNAKSAWLKGGDVATLRAPIWRDATTPASALTPAAPMTVPLFTGHF